MKAKAETARMVREIKATMRSDKFPGVVAAGAEGSPRRAPPDGGRSSGAPGADAPARPRRWPP